MLAPSGTEVLRAKETPGPSGRVATDVYVETYVKRIGSRRAYGAKMRLADVNRSVANVTQKCR